jgi:drug/metabolite transporter (DMT)-like permease
MLWMNILNSRLFFGTRAGPGVIAGSLLGVAGILLLFLPEIRAISFSDASFFGACLAVSGAFVASLGNMVSQAAQNRRLPIVQSNAWGMLYGTLITGAIALLQGKAFQFDTSAPYVLSLAYLSLFGSIVAFGSYLTLLGRIGAHKAGYAVVMFPVVAIIVSVMFEGLTLTTEMTIGVVLVLLGNIVILGVGRKAVADGQKGVLPGRTFGDFVEKLR